ncbi:hypothetical protein I3843_02G111300 [Carya illinoinensis]|uniref:Uncharacterized protein n=2 Tax=Carya illinoinensis TaxID=32201 RepID=A0A8T1RF14_CARIL|nr:uncharacterized protein LOC122300839 [Carya illinoinensis]XP_042967686.1 uncharacterized protein LOC122300839 [Carya illinoinensis]XP_042967687.1 uncharacterized protein LOC122300839 [Carya illinoinensis]KAG2722418.1 hypothetical protein I3760_02G127800 [Carya illinoinensis]KAG2722419.1 hypothetical protein I3760_02G127800 [Carya illinoinensis]KAG6664943.1 hypothetical protein CIPAW_02G128300 [Carya illinoinensis]KAG6727360.1 hypothetical protein I3842_02G125800 [Carya illinoinensis]KAG67
MGGVIGKAANGIGGVLGNAFLTPIRTIFGGSCEGVCSGPWDVVCFIEHLCVSNLVKLLMILVLCYIMLLFFYLLLKVGICQCIARSLCKMCWAACETYWFALEDITCLLWHKLKNTKRINRRRRRQRFQDVELGSSSSYESDFSDDYHHLNVKRKRKKDRLRSSPYPPSRHSNHSHHHHHTRDISTHVKGGSQRLRSSRQLQLSKVRNAQREARNFKKRRLR